MTGCLLTACSGGSGVAPEGPGDPVPGDLPVASAIVYGRITTADGHPLVLGAGYSIAASPPPCPDANNLSVGAVQFPTAPDGTYRMRLTLASAPGNRCLVVWAVSYGVPGYHAAVTSGPEVYFAAGAATDSAELNLALPLP
jgi:hypothetical protein